MALPDAPPPSTPQHRKSAGQLWRGLRILLVAGLPLFWGAAIFLSQTQTKLFLRLTEEDGPIELLQLPVLFGAAIVASAIAWRLWRKNEKCWATIYAGVALGFVLVVGEEVSWGQRIFGVEPGVFFTKNNKQHETNLHNLAFIMPLAPHLITFVLVVLSILSIQSGRISRETRARWKIYLWMPPLFLLPAWLCYASYRAFRTYRSLIHVRSPLVLSRLEEPAELIFYSGLLAFSLVVLWELRSLDSLEET